jgi:hypothetical protein
MTGDALYSMAAGHRGWNSVTVLSQAEIDGFVARGYVPIRGAVLPGVAQACQDVIWSELGTRGVMREDPSTWTEPVVRMPCPEGGPFAEAGTGPLLWEACDQLVGAGRWWQRRGVGGSIPVRFPGESDPGDAGWHIESSYEAGGQQRVSVRSRARGLLALYLFSDVDEECAPTRLRAGSHLDIPPILAPAGDDGLEWSEAARRAVAASAHRPTALATGRAGDVFLCHPFLVHAASWPHRGRFPRMMAQPSVALLGEYPLHALPPAPPSPVEQAILSGLASARQ